MLLTRDIKQIRKPFRLRNCQLFVLNEHTEQTLTIVMVTKMINNRDVIHGERPEMLTVLSSRLAKASRIGWGCVSQMKINYVYYRTVYRDNTKGTKSIKHTLFPESPVTLMIAELARIASVRFAQE